MTIIDKAVNKIKTRFLEKSMGFIEDTLAHEPVPNVVKIIQKFDTSCIADIDVHTYHSILHCESYKKIRNGQTIAIAVGSRGIEALPDVLRALVRAIRVVGAMPFIVPAMGSHGGATAEGQKMILSTLNVTEDSIGCPIISSMDVDQIGEVMSGKPVYIDHNANSADGIIIVNRIKAHTSFRARYESGLMKMMAIGLGKQKGAEEYHRAGIDIFPTIIENVGLEVIRKAKVLFGIGIVENAFGKAREIVALDPCDIPIIEPKLLLLANQLQARLFSNHFDVLIVMKMGKEYSGTGMDTNIIGRYYNEKLANRLIQINRIGVLDLTDKSCGNANGVGLVDVISQRLYKKIDFEQTYPNALTSSATKLAMIPMIMKSDLSVIKACIKTCMINDHTKTRLAIIEHTKNLNTLFISENMIDEVSEHNNVSIVGKPFPLSFDQNGNLSLDFT